MTRTLDRREFEVVYNYLFPHTQIRIFSALVPNGREHNIHRVKLEEVSERQLTLFTRKGNSGILQKQRQLMNNRPDVGAGGDFQNDCILRHRILESDD